MSVRNRLSALIGIGLIAAACGSTAAAAVGQGPVTDELRAVQAAGFDRPEVEAAIEIAEGYIDARSRWDGAAATELLDPDAIVIDTPIATAAEQLDLLRFFESVDWRWTVTDCEEARLDGSSDTTTGRGTPTDPVEIVCQYVSENAWSRAIGAGPIAGQFRLAIGDGLITELYHDYDVVTWEDEVVGTFRAWLENNAPEAGAVLWETETFRRADDADRSLPRRVVPALTDEAAEAFAALTTEFVETAS